MHSTDTRSGPMVASSTPPAAHPLDRYSNSAQPAQQPGGDSSPYFKSAAPTIQMPKGGGALKGIDEKFSVNAANGTASLAIPLPLTPGRGGFTPALALSYNSGSGNGPFGLGWSMGLPSVRRKTDKRLPQYDDAHDSDTFLLAGAEDLVPWLVEGADDTWSEGAFDVGYRIRRYRPRTEGLWARIEHIRRPGAPGSWWRVTTKDDVTTWYGLTAAARIADPEDAGRIFEWLPELVTDSKGNLQQYRYAAEDLVGVPAAIHEAGRQAGYAPFANTYLKSVGYCNVEPWFAGADPYRPELPAAALYLMEAVLDYGEHAAGQPDYAPVAGQPWACRPDPHSDFRPGFEIRTYRRCTRVLQFHRFRELNDGGTLDPVLVRSLSLEYAYPDLSTSGGLVEADSIVRAVQTGWKQIGTSWRSKDLPALTFDYQPLQWDTTVHAVDRDDATGAPQGFSGPYQWTDLWGEGLPGIFTEQGAGWFYKENWGNGHLAPIRQVAQKPSLSGLQFADLDADGRRQAVSHDPALPGYFELNDDQAWEPFRAFPQTAHLDWNSPFTKTLDLDGDGRTDALLIDDTVWTWFQNRGTGGWAEGGRVSQPLDEAKGPRLVLSDAVQQVFLADMNGDGLTDLVRIQNGSVCYWPNKGWGRFGAKVTMSDAPKFDLPGQFDPRRLHLADISGTGAPDLLYRERDGRVTAWVNRGGNGFGPAVNLGVLPDALPESPLAVLDFLGTGTGCLVWSSPLPQHAGAPLRYIDLMGGQKPLLLRSYSNGMGKVTTVTYRSSVQYYLEDKAAGTPWATRLPFPVHCIASVTTEDKTSQTAYTQTYRYRHGYYDHAEREFRGFGYVETTDADTAKVDATHELDQAPVLTKTWYHTGAWMREGTLLDAFAKEYYHFSGWDKLPTQAHFPEGLTAVEQRQAHRALKGVPLRQEVYALDGSAQEAIPYTVTVSAHRVKRVQPGRDGFVPASGRKPAVFLTVPEESLAWSCERRPEDARLAHSLTLATDTYGHVTRSAHVAYPRMDVGRPNGVPEAVYAAQTDNQYITLSETAFTNDVFGAAASWRLRVPCQTQAWELTGTELTQPLWTPDALNAAVDEATAIDNAATPNGSLQKRLLALTRSLFYADDAAGVRPFGTLESLALPYSQFTLAFTGAGLTRDYGTDVSMADLLKGGYYCDWPVAPDELWPDSWGAWVFSGAALYDDAAATFYTPDAYRDPWGAETTVAYWSDYRLLPAAVTDALGNSTSVARYNWRILQPELLFDSNSNRTQMQYDTLGWPVALALQGKDGAAEGDSLDGLDPESGNDLYAQEAFWGDRWTLSPGGSGSVASDLLQAATWRCVYRLEEGRPAAVAMIARERHWSETGLIEESDSDNPLLVRFTYTDGLGRVLMHKAQCEPANIGTVSAPVTARWVGSGRTVYNNKGKAVLQYEPYFSTTQGCDTAEQAAAGGVSPRLHYDALGRLWKTEAPDGTYTETRWDSWRTEAWDAGDTVLQSTWYAARMALPATDDAYKAAQQSAHYADTPTVQHLDGLGRPFYTVQHNREPASGAWTDAFYHSWEELDIEGQRLAVHDARGLTPLQYCYNVLNAPCWQSSVDSGTTFTLVDAAGQSYMHKDAEGRTFRTAYDALRRPTALHCNDGSVSLVLEVFEWGEAVPVSSSRNLRGRLWRHWDGAGRVEVKSYDFKGKPQTTCRRFAKDATTLPTWDVLDESLLEDGLDTTARVDALSRPVAVILSDGSTLVYGYDRGGLPAREAVEALPVTGASADLVTETRYNARGQKTKEVRGNGTVVTWAYDPVSFRVMGITTKRQAGGDTVQDLAYVYDAVGNAVLRRDGAQQAVFFNNGVALPEASYTYDALYRLVKATGREHVGQNVPSSWDDGPRVSRPHPEDGSALQAYIEYYTYDAVGNPLQVRHTAGGAPYANYWTRDFTVDSASNRMTDSSVGGSSETGGAGYGYDGRGNVISGHTHLSSCGYDALNRLAYVEALTATWHYQYDGGGERVRKRSDGDRSRVYVGPWERYEDGQGLVRHSLKAGSCLIETRVGGQDSGTAAVNARLRQLVRYQYADHLGSASLELDGDGAVISFEEYFPFGSTSFQSGRSEAEVQLKRYRYTDKERDEETGFNYHGARYYVPWLLRWMAVDPLESKYAGMSPYNYCANNPVLYYDPDGRAFTIKAEPKRDTGQIAPLTLAPMHALPSAGAPVTQAEAARTISLPEVNVVADKPGFWNGVKRVGRKFVGGLVEGAGDAIVGTVKFAVNIFRLDEQNSLWQVGKALHQIVTDPVGTGRALVDMVRNTDWKDPATYGKIAGNLLVNIAGPGLVAKGIKAVGEAAQLSQAVRGAEELAGLQHADDLAAGSMLATPGVAGTGTSSTRSLSTRFVTSADGTVTDLKPTLDRISTGGTFPHRNDGSVFKNFPPRGQSSPLLPVQPQGYYREFVHPTPGATGPGAMRIVTGNGGEAWFTPDHYNTFIPIR